MIETQQVYADLRDKVVWITGAAKGMGYFMADAFARQGARLALLDLDGPGLENAKSQLALDSSRCLSIVASVTDAAAMDAAVIQIVEVFGQLDVLVNNAGISMNKPTLTVSAEEWLQTVNINLNGVFFCAQAAGRQMVAQRAGSIICMGSIYGVTTAPNRAAYCATKAGVVALSKSLAAEWASSGVRVNALCPGYVETPFLNDLMARGALNRQSLIARVPLGYLAKPEQMAEVVLYMASNVSSYMTGHAMVVDGGWTADGFKELNEQ